MRATIKPVQGFDHSARRHILSHSYFTSSASQATSTPKPSPKPSHSNQRVRQAASDRELVLDVLSSTATKRDARIYLSRFGSLPKSQKEAQPRRHEITQLSGVNLGSLFQTPNSVETSPQFRQYPKKDKIVDPSQAPLHTAVLVIRSVSTIQDAVLEGVGRTVAQLSRLGLNCMILVDDEVSGIDRTSLHKIQQQVDRVVSAVEKEQTARARRLDGLFSRLKSNDGDTTVELHKPVHLYKTFQRDLIPVSAPLIYDQGEKLIGLDANGAALALAHSFNESSANSGPSHSPQEFALDRVIVLDPRGGIPQVSLGGSHVFVNLEQEFSDISKDLERLLSLPGKGQDNQQDKTSKEQRLNVAAAAAVLNNSDILGHLANLQLARGVLRMLPATSSALITTPQAAAYSAALPQTTDSGPNVGTRSQRNPLIHNLLTDKPLFSSSLPRQRISAAATTETPTNHPSLRHAPPTHLKHGMPVAVVPNPVSDPWHPPQDGLTYSVSLDDPRLDIPRLVHLIEDSFGRPLDQDHYFSRIRPILAGIIIAGDYEGGAILTWETPTSRPRLPDSPTATNPNPRRLVPYLDKFAVLKRSQGAGGVADVVFSTMVRRCFPQGVCWRSRRGNPVNKWYFERSRGTYKLPLAEPGGQGWTMFWTTEGLAAERFGEYAEVCAAVPSSWADGRMVLD